MKWFAIVTIWLVGLEFAWGERFRSPLPLPVTPTQPLQTPEVAPAPAPKPVPAVRDVHALGEEKIAAVAEPITFVPKAPPAPRPVQGMEGSPVEPTTLVSPTDGWKAEPAAPTVVWTNSTQSAPGVWSPPAPARAKRGKRPPPSIWDK